MGCCGDEDVRERLLRCERLFLLNKCQNDFPDSVGKNMVKTNIKKS